MKRLTIVFMVTAALGVSGCHRHNNDDHGHAHENGAHDHSHGTGASHGHSHGDDAKSFSGATLKEGTGIILLPQTHRALGIQTGDVEQRKLARRVHWLARVYNQRSQAVTPVANPLLGGALAAGFMSAREADGLKVGMEVELSGATQKLNGQIVDIHKGLSASEVEVVTQLTGVGQDSPVGTFLRAEAAIATEQPVTAVAKQAVIRGAETNHVYVVNGEAYLRTLVETGIESDGFVEIREGLLSGDSVVTQGALDLWLIELRAVKGGQGCCPAPPARGKK